MSPIAPVLGETEAGKLLVQGQLEKIVRPHSKKRLEVGTTDFDKMVDAGCHIV